MDYIKMATFCLSLIGSALGLYNFILGRRSQNQVVKKGFAIMLLSLEPILKKIAALPLSDFNELKKIEPTMLAASLEEIEIMVNESKDSLIELFPEMALYIINLLGSAKEFRDEVLLRGIDGFQTLNLATEFLFNAYAFSLMRRFSSKLGMELRDQEKASAENYYGDQTILKFSRRWKDFARAKFDYSR